MLHSNRKASPYIQFNTSMPLKYILIILLNPRQYAHTLIYTYIFYFECLKNKLPQLI